MNDSGFWVVCKTSGLPEKEMLRSVSVMFTIMGCVGFVMSSVAMPPLSFGVVTTRTLPMASSGPALTLPNAEVGTSATMLGDAGFAASTTLMPLFVAPT